MKVPMTVIIPTGDRPKCMQICLTMLASQTIKPSQVIVIDDGVGQDTETSISRQVTDYIRRGASIADPPHTLPVNILEALKLVTQDHIVFMEDDEWYHPEYLAKMWMAFEKGYRLVGQRNSLYYRYPSLSYKYQNNNFHASLCATGLHSSLIPALQVACDTAISMGNGFVDMNLWRVAPEAQRYLFGGDYHVGMKGLPGRKGQTMGWREGNAHDGYTGDPDMVFLRRVIGNDVDFYKKGAAVWQG